MGHLRHLARRSWRSRVWGFSLGVLASPVRCRSWVRSPEGAKGLVSGGCDDWPGPQNILEAPRSPQHLRWDEGFLFPCTSPTHRMQPPCSVGQVSDVAVRHLWNRGHRPGSHVDSRAGAVRTSCTPKAGFLPVVPSLWARAEDRAGLGGRRTPQTGSVTAGARAPGFLRAAPWPHRWPALPAPGRTPTPRAARR